jgi:hypothetical protein
MHVRKFSFYIVALRRKQCFPDAKIQEALGGLIIIGQNVLRLAGVGAQDVSNFGQAKITHDKS